MFSSFGPLLSFVTVLSLESINKYYYIKITNVKIYYGKFSIIYYSYCFPLVMIILYGSVVINASLCFVLLIWFDYDNSGLLSFGLVMGHYCCFNNTKLATNSKYLGHYYFIIQHPSLAPMNYSYLGPFYLLKVAYTYYLLFCCVLSIWIEELKGPLLKRI